jgi:hypothetical protein
MYQEDDQKFFRSNKQEDQVDVNKPLGTSELL